MSHRVLPPLIDDQPTSSDFLGYNVLAKEVCKILTSSATKTPISIGLYGLWGSGKTSLLKMIQERLFRADKVRTVWFDLWHERFSTSPIISLVQTISNLESSKKSIKTMCKVLIESIASMLLSTATHGKENIKDVKERFKEAEAQDIEGMKNINLVGKFERLVKEVTNPDKRLIVLIDDLDRCRKEEVGNLLDQIHHFMYVQNIAFILAVDRELLQKTFAERYGTFAGIEFESVPELPVPSTDYLEKIIQLEFHIPPPRDTVWKSYVQKIFKGMPGAIIAENYAHILPINPRKIKLLRNRIILSCRLLRHKTKDARVMELCAKWHLIKEIRPKIANVVLLSPETFITIQEVLKTGKEGRVGEQRISITDVMQEMDADILPIIKEEPAFSLSELHDVISISGMNMTSIWKLYETERGLVEIVSRVHSAKKEMVTSAKQELAKLPVAQRAAVLRDLRRKLYSVAGSAKCATFDVFIAFQYYEACEDARRICQDEKEDCGVRIWACCLLIYLDQPDAKIHFNLIKRLPIDERFRKMMAEAEQRLN